MRIKAFLFAVLLQAVTAIASACPASWADSDSNPDNRTNGGTHQKLRGLLRYPDLPGQGLATYCNIHGPSASSPEFAIITQETKSNAALKRSWQLWSQNIVDELRARWHEIATVEGDCDVASIQVRNGRIVVGPDDYFPHNKLIVAEVDDCLHTLDGSKLLELPPGTSVKSVTFFASFASGPRSHNFDWKPQLEDASLFGQPCLAGASNHESITLSSPSRGAETQGVFAIPMKLFKFMRK